MLSAFLVPAIAVVTVVILILQYRLETQRHKLEKQLLKLETQGQTREENRLKMDLFDKRWEIYERIMKFIIRCGLNTEFKSKDISIFHRDVESAKFLFEDDVLKVIEKLSSNAARLGLLKDKKIPDQEEVDEIYKLQNWFYDEIENVTKTFNKYMKIV